MTRAEKIRLLKDHQEGRVSIEEYFAPFFLIWLQVPGSPGYLQLDGYGPIFKADEIDQHPLNVRGRQRINLIMSTMR